MYDLDLMGDIQIGTFHGRWEFSDPCSTSTKISFSSCPIYCYNLILYIIVTTSVIIYFIFICKYYFLSIYSQYLLFIEVNHIYILCKLFINIIHIVKITSSIFVISNSSAFSTY